MTIQLKRAYDAYSQQDGFRVLVDKLWPRGVSKEQAHIDLWLKEVAPSTELRKWFNHQLDKWPEFQQRYLAELQRSEALQRLQEQAQQGSLTLVFAAKDQAHNNAVVLKQLLERSHS
ncbi:MAG: DUF488 domain-containing protein [Venatoribacter sp.]